MALLQGNLLNNSHTRILSHLYRLAVYAHAIVTSVILQLDQHISIGGTLL